MLVKSQVKYIQSLGHKKFRDADGVFVAEGPKIVQEFLQSDNCSLVQCFATGEWIRKNSEILKRRDHLVFETHDNELERISRLATPNQVLAVFTKPVFKNMKKTAGVTLLLDAIQDPGNLGTILRTADWFGVKQVICSPDTADGFNPKVVQAAMGSQIRVELSYTSLAEYIGMHPGKTVYASSLEGEDLQEDLPVCDAFLLMGNESRGISPELERLSTRRIRVPRKGGAESLNVAVAAGILLSRFRIFIQRP